MHHQLLHLYQAFRPAIAPRFAYLSKTVQCPGFWSAGPPRCSPRTAALKILRMRGILKGISIVHVIALWGVWSDSGMAGDWLARIPGGSRTALRNDPWKTASRIGRSKGSAASRETCPERRRGRTECGFHVSL